MTPEEILAKHIGNLTVENAKLIAMVEALKAELHKRDEIIKKLNEAEPELPMNGKDHVKEIRNGAH